MENVELETRILECTECGHTQNVQVMVEGNAVIVVSGQECEECGTEFDYSEEEYD